MFQLRRREAQHLATIHADHCVKTRGVRLHHPPEPGFGHFDHPVIMEDEIKAGVEANEVQRGGRNSSFT
jgi:hypothetical protein